MSQSYEPQDRLCASPVPHSAQERIQNGLDIEQVQGAYVQLKDRLSGALDAASHILNDIRDFNKHDWIVRYPHVQTSAQPAPGPSLRRSLSFADDPLSTHNVVLRPGVRRSLTLASVQENEHPIEAPTAEEDSLLPDFHVLRLDLKLGPNGSSVGPSSLVSQLEKSSIANLLEERIGASLSHMAKLRARVEDTSSKVLVTGDLNAGKSTLVNALLRREVMPVDQQPCTAMFCEVHDALENNGKEEVHVIKEGSIYKASDPSTYVAAELGELENIVSEAENGQRILKLYVNDARAPNESLIHNGIVDIALIDAPGLNRDSLKTTALFARQEEIDVVVFVVSAENHFTLSAKEFLWNASNEKAYLFIVVNRFDQIKDKERCKRLVLEQIKQLSPRTFEEAEDLVHFVDSNSALHSAVQNSAFSKLESDLRSFVLVKRSKSKLLPATTYLENLLADVSLLSCSNAILADSERKQARADLDLVKPVLEQMQANRDGLEDSLEAVEEESTTLARVRARERLVAALDRVGNGEVAEVGSVSLPVYPGLLGIWDYAREVRKALLVSLDMAVKLAEDEARGITTDGVTKVAQLAESYLPEGVERSHRVFMPSAMFSPRANKKGSKRNSGAIVAGGVHGLGIGLSQRHEMLEVSFLDVMDVQHRLSLHLKRVDDSSVSASEGALSLASLGVGALTIAGGKAVGARGLLEGLVRISDLFGNETARKWAAPVLGAFTIGLTVYFVLELPHAIPRNVGRRIKASLVHDGEEEELKFVNAHYTRVSRETRKVLRLATWDLRERFRGAMEERGREVKGKEEMERKAIAAFEFFNSIAARSDAVNDEIHQ